MSSSHKSHLGAKPADTSSWIEERRRGFEDIVAELEDYGVFLINPSGIILDWNLGAERIFGYKAGEIVGHHFSRFFSETERGRGVPDGALEIAATEGSFGGEGWRLRQDGSPFWGHVHITALRSEPGIIEGFLQITRDLTQRRMTMEELRQSEERFRLLVESVQDYAIFMLDPDGHVVSWNNGARRIKGYEQDEVIGRHFSLFYPVEAVEAKVPEALLGLALKDGRSEQEGWRMRKDGTRFWSHVVITALHDHLGELRGFAKITRDLTYRRQVENLREAGRRKDAFLATLAHELRNPLAPILPGIDIILRSPGDPERVAEVAAMLRRQVDQMARLIEDLVDVSRITTGKIELKKADVPFVEVLERALEEVRPLIERHSLTLEVKLPSSPVTVHADSHRLAQVISNLLFNSVKYTPAGGRVTLTAAAESQEVLRIVVADNGKGIPKEVQDSIFDLFEQGGSGLSEGLGIGLTLVRSLTEMHGGSASVESGGEGLGSEFTLVLPVIVPGDGAARDSPATAEPALPKKDRRLRVLVVDDGRSAADLMGMFFRMEGMDAEVAYDGEQAVETARVFEPDLVFLDLGMPRLDGFDACRQIRKWRPHTVLIALSGWGSKDDRRRTADAGFDEHLVKPVAPDILRDFVSRYFDASGDRRRKSRLSQDSRA